MCDSKTPRRNSMHHASVSDGKGATAGSSVPKGHRSEAQPCTARPFPAIVHILKTRDWGTPKYNSMIVKQ